MIVLSICFSEEYETPADLGELGITDYNEDMIFLYLLAISAIIQAAYASLYSETYF